MLTKLSSKLDAVRADDEIKSHTLINFGSKLKKGHNFEYEVLSDHISKYIYESVIIVPCTLYCNGSAEDGCLINSREISLKLSKNLMSAHSIIAE